MPWGGSGTKPSNCCYKIGFLGKPVGGSICDCWYGIYSKIFSTNQKLDEMTYIVVLVGAILLVALIVEWAI